MNMKTKSSESIESWNGSNIHCTINSQGKNRSYGDFHDCHIFLEKFGSKSAELETCHRMTNSERTPRQRCSTSSTSTREYLNKNLIGFKHRTHFNERELTRSWKSDGVGILQTSFASCDDEAKNGADAQDSDRVHRARARAHRTWYLFGPGPDHLAGTRRLHHVAKQVEDQRES